MQEVDDPYFSSNEEEEEEEIAAEREGIENYIERDKPDDENGDVQQEDRPRRYPRGHPTTVFWRTKFTELLE